MNQTEDLQTERIAVKAAVDAFAPITKAWAFEEEPASAKPLLDFYLDAVKTCDLFVLVLGGRITRPVSEEHQTAVDYAKPRLVFCKNVEVREPEVEMLIKDIGVKYDRFTDAVELREQFRTSLGNYLLGRIRGESTTGNGFGDRIGRLRSFIRMGRLVRILPTVPPSESNEFAVLEVGTHTVTFQKGGVANVRVPFEGIAQILETDAYVPATVCRKGRLQWVSLKRNWYFFPEAPPEHDLLNIGLGKTVPLEYHAHLSKETLSLLTTVPFNLRWHSRNNIAGKAVFFDVDGKHLTTGNQILVCTEQ